MGLKTIPYSSCGGTNTILDRASVHTDMRTTILNVDRHVSGRFLCHSLRVHTKPNSFSFQHAKLSGIVWTLASPCTASLGQCISVTKTHSDHVTPNAPAARNNKAKGLGKCRHNLSWRGVVLWSVFTYDVTAAMLVFQNNETAAMLVYQENPLGV